MTSLLFNSGDLNAIFARGDLELNPLNFLMIIIKTQAHRIYTMRCEGILHNKFY